MGAMLKSLRDFFERNIAEIMKDKALRYYGIAVAACHAFTAMWWLDWVTYEYNFPQPYRPKASFLAEGLESICWPFFENCWQYRFLTEPQARMVMFFYLAISVIAMIPFLSKKWVRFGYYFLIFVSVLKYLIIAQDFRYTMTQHYMHFFLTVAFLFMPFKREILHFCIIMFYFFAGTLKLNMEWISGAALYRTEYFIIPKALIPASCVYVIIMELVLIWGILAKHKWIFWGTFAQLVLFHLVSWPIVDFYYPMLMFAVISIFPMAYLIPDPKPRLSPRLNLWQAMLNRKLALSTYAFMAVFASLQTIPYFFPGDAGITGEGRQFALHMFDKKVVCKKGFDFKYSNGTVKKESEYDFWVIPRHGCDPIVLYNYARGLCQKHKNDPKFSNLDISLKSRLSSQTDKDVITVVDIKDYCSKNVEYDMFTHNPWIQTGDAERGIATEK